MDRGCTLIRHIEKTGSNGLTFHKLCKAVAPDCVQPLLRHYSVVIVVVVEKYVYLFGEAYDLSFNCYQAAYCDY